MCRRTFVHMRDFRRARQKGLWLTLVWMIKGLEPLAVYGARMAQRFPELT